MTSTPRPQHHHPIREAHAHLPSFGRALAMTDLSAATSAQACLELIRTAESTSQGWILAHGARMESWSPARWPTRTELDAAFGNRPCAIMSFDHHAVVANTAAMRAAGFDDASPDPPGGVIVREHAGEPTGLLLETAALKVWNAAPEPDPSQRRLHVLAALDALRTHGFVEVHDLLSPPWLGPLLAELHDQDRLPLRVGLFAPFDRIDAAVHESKAWQRPTLSLLGAKLFSDGTLNSRTAWMLEPYQQPMDGMPRGKPLLTVDAMFAAMRHVASLGVGLAIHAIGDGAVRAVLDARRLSRDAGANAPLRIEHCELIDERDIPRFAALDVVASVQPCHLLTDIEVLTRQLPHRLDRVLPFRDLIAAGLEPGRSLIFGSDVPIVRPHPNDSIHAAIARRSEGMPPDHAIAMAQALTEPEAWACFAATSNAPGL